MWKIQKKIYLEHLFLTVENAEKYILEIYLYREKTLKKIYIENLFIPEENAEKVIH